VIYGAQICGVISRMTHGRGVRFGNLTIIGRLMKQPNRVSVA
jgi:hypothetical protein